MIELLDEEGKSFEFAVHDIIETSGKTYAVLEPLVDGSGDGLVMRVEKDPDGHDILMPVTGDEELSFVASLLEEGLLDDD